MKLQKSFLMTEHNNIDDEQFYESTDLHMIVYLNKSAYGHPDELKLTIF